MDFQIFANISRIIERDSKATTYKYALLRGIIDIIQDDSPFIQIVDNSVVFPMGLMVEKWIVYYYPIINSKEVIPQINGSSNLAFNDKFKTVISYYNVYNGVSELYNNLRRNGISLEIKYEFINLVKSLCKTISKMPMRYIGKSVTKQEYSIFKIISSGKLRESHILDSQWLIEGCGSFSIPLEYYNAFKVLGSFITGTDSIIFKWAEFSVIASGKSLSTEKVLGEILQNPITARDVLVSKNLYKSILSTAGTVNCAWTGTKTVKYDIDHLIPFSVWKNNNLWNLLPVLPKINSIKKDKIPSLDTLEKSKDLIIHYWELITANQEIRFQKELKIALLGMRGNENWQKESFSQLKQTCSNLINVRGYEEWNP